MPVSNPRRYALLKYYVNFGIGEMGLAGFWHAKHDEASGTPLPASFVSRAALVAALYSAVEDLDGADVAELQVNAGLSRREAQAALTAAAAL